MKLLVAYDEDQLGSKVLDHALKRAMASQAFVYIVHTFDSNTTGDEFSELENRLDQIKREVFEKNGVRCEVHILVRGLSPGEDIVQYASEKNTDEIIIGIEKRSRVGKLVFGSTARYVILEAHCPVLAVK